MHRLVCLIVCLSAGSLYAADLRLNRTIELLEAGKPVIGGFIFDMSDEVAIDLSMSGLDFAVIDLEHRPMDTARLRTFLLGMTNRQRILEKQSVQLDVTPIIRLPDSGSAQTELLAKQVLNTGAFGLMFPTVESREDALMAVRVSRYPQSLDADDREPAGLRGFEPFHPGMWYWGLDTQGYFERADVWPLDPAGEILVVIQIESAAGVENIEQILSVPGIGAVMIGSFDLSTSLGMAGDVQAPAVREATVRVVQACLERGIAVGSTAGSVEANLEMGQSILAMGFFGGLFPEGAANLEKVRRLRGD
jgi:4-hydroxy-2-oxoheptanedioate aldolase